jgi:hypothetical protein
MYVDKTHDLITDPVRISPHRFHIQSENQESLNLESLAALLFNPPRHYKTDFILFPICQKSPDACFCGDI